MESVVLSKEEILHALESVMDPEIPTLSVVDMGMVTDIIVNDNKSVTVKMIPTFTACPALRMIKDMMKTKVESLGCENVTVLVDDTVTWNSDRITERGKKLLEEFGLGSPQRHRGSFGMEEIAHSKCPHCGSTNTTMNSVFGSTLCRSTHYCFDCKQAFERFKPV